MRFTAYYVVSANSHLQKLAAVDEDVALVCETLLIESQEGHLRSSSKDDYALRVKLFVLLHFANEYQAVPSLAKLFDGASITEQLFDTWWNLVVVDEVEPMPTYGSKFKVSGVRRDRVPATRSELVNDWLARVVEFESPTERCS